MRLLQALINQGNSEEEARLIIEEMVENVLAWDDPEEVLSDYGLEPDYVINFLDMLF